MVLTTTYTEIHIMITLKIRKTTSLTAAKTAYEIYDVDTNQVVKDQYGHIIGTKSYCEQRLNVLLGSLL